MSGSQDSRDLSRRAFAGGLAVVSGTGTLLGQEAAASKRRGPQNANATPQNTSRPKQGMPDEVPPFGEAIIFRRKEIAPKIREFGMKEVKLLPGSFRDAQEANRPYLLRLDLDRLLHNFRVNAGRCLPRSRSEEDGRSRTASCADILWAIICRRAL